jgi:hypothetical protein
MITFRIVTPRVTKDIVFEDHVKGNMWLKKLYRVIGREREYRVHDIGETVHAVHVDLPIKELVDKGVSFVGATTVTR